MHFCLICGDKTTEATGRVIGSSGTFVLVCTPHENAVFRGDVMCQCAGCSADIKMDEKQFQVVSGVVRCLDCVDR